MDVTECDIRSVDKADTTIYWEIEFLRKRSFFGQKSIQEAAFSPPQPPRMPLAAALRCIPGAVVKNWNVTVCDIALLFF